MVTRAALMALAGFLIVAVFSGVITFQTFLRGVMVEVECTSLPLDTPPTKEFVMEAQDKALPWSFVSDGQVNPVIRVKRGDVVKIVFRNTGTMMHDISIIGGCGIRSELIGPGESATIVFRPEVAKDFNYICSVPGHRELGMEGLFVVEE